MLQQGISRIPLDRKWGFAADPEHRGRQEGWWSTGLPVKKEVLVPHTWNVDPETEDYRGLGWYEYPFEIRDMDSSNRIWFHFEAVYRDATVWINGQEAGSHTNSGYTSFRIEATPYLVQGGNLLIVAVDNRYSDTALPKANSFDWADDGGMIREVTLMVTGEAAIEFVQIDAIPVLHEQKQRKSEGIIKGAVTFHETSKTNINQVQLQLLLERNGLTIWEGSRTASFPCRTIPLSDIALADVELWHFDHPHLYELTIRVKEGDRIHDEVKVKLGFREFRASGNRLLLNGEPVRLVGVEWMPGSHPMKGMAESEKDRERVLEQLKLANCVLTRFHWQQDDKLLEWCDRNGILVQEELPLWQQPFEPGEETMPVAKQQIFETISRHRHHPSVIAWGMGNELDGQSEQTQKFVQQLKSYTLELDPTRMVNYVSNTVHLEPSKDATGAGDVIMWNDYIGTWHGEHNMEEVIEKLGAAYPDKPIVVAEFGLCEPAFSGGDPKRIEILLEKTEVYRRHPNIAGFIFFSLNDYRTQMGEDGVGRLRQRVHGVTDLYGVEKPSYQLLRQTASPLILETTHNEGTGDLICKFICKKDLPSYSVTGYSLSVLANPEDSEARYDIPPMEPGSSCEMIIPTKGLSDQVRLAIHRPTGFSVLERIVDL